MHGLRVVQSSEEALRRTKKPGYLKKELAKRKKKSGPEYAIPGFDVPVGQPRPVAQRRRPVQARISGRMTNRSTPSTKRY